MPQYMPLWGVLEYKEACRIIWECGYATDPNYPQKLIELIEKYKLFEDDSIPIKERDEKVEQIAKRVEEIKKLNG
ncbi:glucosaminidase domain-containing protein [Cytobacillus praedii]|uniref:glucosaminidase domain-containing protein n=1 Tax=Cytobacillus praedii TaxID=1742358 RepID=UPI000A7CA4D3|nr:glucosaminidase domain-containing protein [Cytobacillus praedii]